jgi:putative tricarboxylic transport membrane protein
MLALGYGFTRISVFVTKVPRKVLAPIFVVLCIVGSYTISNSMFDVYLMLGFGVIGYVFDRLKIPLAPMVLGHGSYLIFLQSPLSACLLAAGLLSILQATPLGRWLLVPFKRLGRLALRALYG